MTLIELVSIYGTKKYTASSGDTLSSVVQTIYNSRDDVYYHVLQALNGRFDWDNLEPGAELFYLPKPACDGLSEYYSRW